jgi:hypothetical protein
MLETHVIYQVDRKKTSCVYSTFLLGNYEENIASSESWTQLLS